MVASFVLIVQEVKHTRKNFRHLAAKLDPKSVESKSTSAIQHEFSNLRFLFMGTSRSYGVHLPDRLNEAFPYLLSPKAVNLAIPGSTPPYATKCAYSMVSPVEAGDAFDVVVLEYETFLPQVLFLAKRLRQRYPKAVIIVTEMWLLKRYVHQPTSKDMGTWSSEFTHATNEMDAKIAEIVQERTNVEDWKYIGSLYSDDMVKAFEQLGVHVIKAPVPSNAHEAIGVGYPLFIGDMHHFSRSGHVYMADLILKDLRETRFRTTHDNTIEPWDEQDQCETWFRTGETTLRHDKGFVMNEYSRGKFALEARAQENWMRIINHSKEPRGLALERMVATPDCRYPSVQIDIVDSSEPPIVDKCPEDAPWPWQVNIAKELFIGKIPPGESTLHFKELEQNKPWPYRVVGFSISKIEKGTHILGNAYIPGSMDCKLDKVLNKIECI
jgi:hypothetical protein